MWLRRPMSRLMVCLLLLAETGLVTGEKFRVNYLTSNVANGASTTALLEIVFRGRNGQQSGRHTLKPEGVQTKNGEGGSVDISLDTCLGQLDKITLVCNSTRGWTFEKVEVLSSSHRYLIGPFKEGIKLKDANNYVKPDFQPSYDHYVTTFDGDRSAYAKFYGRGTMINWPILLERQTTCDIENCIAYCLDFSESCCAAVNLRKTAHGGCTCQLLEADQNSTHSDVIHDHDVTNSAILAPNF